MVAVKLSSVMEVVEVIDRSTFIALESEWNALVKSSRDEPFCRHEYIRAWIDNFAPGAKLKILTGRDRFGKLVAALPLIMKREFIYGLPAQQLISPTNVHSCRFDLIAEDEESAGKAFFSYLASDKSWDVLRITDVPDGGNAWQISHAAQAAGFPTGVYESQRSPYLPLPPSYDELMKGLNTKFKANLRRRRKRLEENGEVSIERIVGGALLPNYMEQCFEIEQSGWKGRGGFAANQNKGAYGFYTELAPIAARQGYLSLFFLKLNGKPIAFHFGFVYNDIYSLLMTSYDESLKECSPGHLLMEEALKDSISRGLKEFDFLGCDLSWKLDWSRAVRIHSWLFIFRGNSFGRALHKAKFKLIPEVKKMLERWRR